MALHSTYGTAPGLRTLPWVPYSYVATAGAAWTTALSRHRPGGQRPWKRPRIQLPCLPDQPGKGGRTATRTRPSLFRCPPVAKPPERQSLSLPLPKPPSSFPLQQPSSHRPTRPPVDTSRGPPRTHLVSRRRQAIDGLHPVASSPAWPERRAPCRSPIASPLSRWGFVVPAARSLRAATTIDPLDSALSAFFPSLARLRTPGPPASLVVFWAP